MRLFGLLQFVCLLGIIVFPTRTIADAPQLDSGSIDSATNLPAKPWESVTEAHLRAFRGAISTTRLNLPFGPRPGQDDNVLFTPTYQVYDDAERAQMREAYASRGYDHWAIGPIAHRARLYHDQFPPAPFDSIREPDKYADLLVELWRAGQIPVYFALPDTPDFMNHDGWKWDAVERELTPVYKSPRWQSLIRIVALAWEPDVPAAEWQRAVRWLAEVFPHALRYIHLPADHFAPCRVSELSRNGGTIPNEAAAWRPIAPLLHGVLFQFGAMGNRDRDGEPRSKKQEFLFALWNNCRHFQNGFEGWPTNSAAGDRPLDVVAFEYASYWSYWKNIPESLARDWGAAAIGTGSPMTDPVTGQTLDLRGKVAGFGDGGN